MSSGHRILKWIIINILVSIHMLQTISMMLSEVESIIDRSISANEWNSLT